MAKTRWQGFNGTTFKTKSLNRRQVKQVQRQIEKNKRIKNTYVGIFGDFTDVNTATPLQTYFIEFTQLLQGDKSYERSEFEVLMKSYNLKLGVSAYTNDATVPSTLMIPWSFRIIIARSKIGAQTNIVDLANASIVDFRSQPHPDKYQIYTDEIISISGNTSAVNGAPNISPGYLWHFYKSFKNKKVPHMIVGYDEDSVNAAVNNPIYMKIIVDPGTNPAGETYNFSLNGFVHLKYFDKE